MATTNQKHVAEALHLARTINFHTGLLYLADNVKGDPAEQKKWFVAKCKEHDIPVFLLPEGFDNLAEGFRAVKEAAINATEKITNAYNNIFVAVNDPKNWVTEKD